jgi:hypothetical protein
MSRERDLLLVAIGASLAGSGTGDFRDTEFEGLGAAITALKASGGADPVAMAVIDGFLSRIDVTRTESVSKSILEEASRIGRCRRAMGWMRQAFRCALRPVGNRAQVIETLEGFGYVDDSERVLPVNQEGQR